MALFFTPSTLFMNWVCSVSHMNFSWLWFHGGCYLLVSLFLSVHMDPRFHPHRWIWAQWVVNIVWLPAVEGLLLSWSTASPVLFLSLVSSSCWWLVWGPLFGSQPPDRRILWPFSAPLPLCRTGHCGFYFFLPSFWRVYLLSWSLFYLCLFLVYSVHSIEQTCLIVSAGPAGMSPW